ncbi:hypothetical protein ACH4T9_12845 [Micromonospora sp. NPDC020750]
MAKNSSSTEQQATQVGQAIRGAGDLSGKTRWQAIERTTKTSR